MLDIDFIRTQLISEKSHFGPQQNLNEIWNFIPFWTQMTREIFEIRTLNISYNNHVIQTEMLTLKSFKGTISRIFMTDQEYLQ